MIEIIPFAIKNVLDEEKCFGRRPALRAGRRFSTGPPPAFGGRRPYKYHRLAFRNSLHRIGIRLSKVKLTFFTLF
jgi:hypothetical protein